MEGISDLRIIGLDIKRPPRISKRPYIDLFFQLSHKAAPDWCGEFNDLMANNQYKPSIKVNEGLFIDSWVRSTDEIPMFLQLLKDKVALCVTNHIDRIEAANRKLKEEDLKDGQISPEQAALNLMISTLEFDPPLE